MPLGEKTKELWKNPEYRKSMSLAHKGQIPWIKGKHTKAPKTAFKKGQEKTENWYKAMHKTKGRKLSVEHRKKIGDAHRGDKNHWWKGGITGINKQIRGSLEYKLWREAVFKRDNWVCKWCLQKGGKLHPHHIKPFCDYPELRFAIDNGLTLCVSCHQKTDNYGGKAHIING